MVRVDYIDVPSRVEQEMNLTLGLLPQLATSEEWIGGIGETRDLVCFRRGPRLVVQGPDRAGIVNLH